MEDKENLKGIDRDWEDKPKSSDPDEYGLPDVSYDPLEKEEDVYNHEKDSTANNSFRTEKYYEYEEKRGSSLLVVLLILFLLGGIGFGVYWFQFRDTGQNVDNINTAPPPTITYEEPEPQSEPEYVEEFPMPVTKTTGDLSTISSRSGSYYIVVGSFIDDDLAKDQSDKLNDQGMDTYMIEPANNRKFYRLAVGSFGSLSEATDKMEDLKMTFGQGIWVLKY